MTYRFLPKRSRCPSLPGSQTQLPPGCTQIHANHAHSSLWHSIALNCGGYGQVAHRRVLWAAVCGRLWMNGYNWTQAKTQEINSLRSWSDEGHRLWGLGSTVCSLGSPRHLSMTLGKSILSVSWAAHLESGGDHYTKVTEMFKVWQQAGKMDDPAVKEYFLLL